MASNKNLFILKLFLLFCLYVLVVGTLFELLWNWLMPTIFGLQPIHFGQAIGLMLLGRLFLGISTRAHFGGIKKMSRGSDSTDDFKPNVAEREKWRNEWRKFCKPEDENEKK